jgi:hypothetical protein
VATDKEKKKVYIKSAGDIFNALVDEDQRVRRNILRAIRDNPEKILSYGSEGGKDIVDVLLELADKSKFMSEKLSYAYAAFAFDDKRILRLAKEIFIESDNSNLTLLAAEKLTNFDKSERKEFFSKILMSTEDNTRRRCAANLLSDIEELDAEVRLRVFLVGDHEVTPPDFDEENISIWISELQGDYSGKAEKAVSDNYEKALPLLLKKLDDMDEELVCRIIFLSGEKVCGEALPYIAANLSPEKSDDIIVSSIKALLYFDPDAYEDELRKLLSRNSSSIIAGVVSTGILDNELSAYISPEEDEKVRMAALQRIYFGNMMEYLGVLGAFLGDKNWKVRAKVSDILAKFAPESIDILKRAMCSECELTKISAAQAMNSIELNSRSDIRIR